MIIIADASLYRRMIIPFCILGVLLIIAIVFAIIVTRKELKDNDQ